MNKPLEDLVDDYRKSGPKQFSHWSDESFESYVSGPFSNLQTYLEYRDNKNADEATPVNYLNLIYEGVGAGWLRLFQRERPCSTFLEHCLGHLVPYRLGTVPQKKRGAVLQQIWNIGEGMAQEPQWLNHFAIARTDWAADLESLDRHLTEVLAPVLSPPPPAEWSGRFRLQVLNLRHHAEEFVPGRMYLASPAILCLEDRCDSEETLAILLQKSVQSEVLGRVNRLPPHKEHAELPSIEATADAIVIAGRKVDAPLISSPRETLCIAGGFVAVTADDSQRLWLVEAE